MSLLSAKDLRVSYGGQDVLQGVSLTLEAGEIVTIVGPNGSGKSTLLRALIGAIKPQSGSVLRPADLRIGYVPQRLEIDPTMPITVNRFLNLPHRVGRDAARTALETAGVPDVAGRQMSQLSGGQFQRVLASDRVICLNGHVCCEGTPEVVSAAPAYRELFGTGTGGALALYRHDHDHHHHHDHDHA